MLLLCLLTLGAHRDSLLPAPETQQTVAAQRENASIAPPAVEGTGRPPVLPLVSEHPSLVEDNSPSPLAGEESAVPPEVALTSPNVIAPVNPIPLLQSTPTLPPTRVFLPVPFAPPAVPPPPPVPPPPTPVQTPVPTQPPPDVNPAGTAVDVLLNSDAAVVSIGSQFSVSVTVNAGTTNPVDAAQVYLNFNPNILQVVSLTGGPDLPEELQSAYDNALGQINYAAGTLDTAVESPFQLLAIRFRAVAQAGPTGATIGFAPLVNPRQTKTVRAGINNTGNLGTLRVVIE